MSAFRAIVRGSVVLAFCAMAAGAQAASGEFDATKFTCLNYTNGMGSSSSTKAQATVGRIWMLGFLAGYYKSSGKLEMTDSAEEIQKLDSAIARKCRDNPANSIHAVAAQAISKDVFKLPKAISADFNAGAYTCGQHLETKTTAANKADLAELWAFAAIEGVKAVGQPDLEIPAASKGPIIDAVNRSCANNKDTSYLDLAAAVADKMKMN